MEVAERCSDPGMRSKAEGLARLSWGMEGRYDEALGAYGQVVKKGGKDALAARIQMAALYLHYLRDRGKAVDLLEEVVSQVSAESPEALAAEMLLMDAQAMPGLKPGSSEQRGQKISPLEVALSPNYPNPFNPTTTLSFTLPEARHVRLLIYNVLGQQVRVLVEGMQKEGMHRVVWDGQDAQGMAVGSGLYFARLEAEGSVRSRKLLLLR